MLTLYTILHLALCTPILLTESIIMFSLGFKLQVFACLCEMAHAVLSTIVQLFPLFRGHGMQRLRSGSISAMYTRGQLDSDPAVMVNTSTTSTMVQVNRITGQCRIHISIIGCLHAPNYFTLFYFIFQNV